MCGPLIPNLCRFPTELDTDLSSAAIEPTSVLSGTNNKQPSSVLVKREETTTTTTTVKPIMIIRPTYVPRPARTTTTATVITNPLLDPNFKPISRSSPTAGTGTEAEEKTKVQKSSVFPSRSAGNKFNSTLMLSFLLALVWAL